MRKTVDTRPLFILGRKRAPRAYKGLGYEARLGDYLYNTIKMVPIPRRASLFLVVVLIHVNRKEEGGETEQQQFTKGCNILDYKYATST